MSPHFGSVTPKRCLDAESKGHLSVVKAIDDNILGIRSPKGPPSPAKSTTATSAVGSTVVEKAREEKSTEETSKSTEQTATSETMLEFLKKSGWG